MRAFCAFLFFFCLISVHFSTYVLPTNDAYALQNLVSPAFTIQKRMMREDQLHGQDTSTSYSASGGSKSKKGLPVRFSHGEGTNTKYSLELDPHVDKGVHSSDQSLLRLRSSGKDHQIEEVSSSHHKGSPIRTNHKPEVTYLKPKHPTVTLSQELKSANAKFKQTHDKMNSKWLDTKTTLRQKILRKPPPSSLPRFSSIAGYHQREDRYPEPRVTLSPTFHQAIRKFDKKFDQNNKGKAKKVSMAQARDRLDRMHQQSLLDHAINLKDAHSHTFGSATLPYSSKPEEESHLLRSKSGVAPVAFARLPSPLASPRRERPHGKGLAIEIGSDSSDRANLTRAKSVRSSRT